MIKNKNMLDDLIILIFHFEVVRSMLKWFEVSTMYSSKGVSVLTNLQNFHGQ